MIAVIDIDHFKSVNDNYGHKTGDHVLRFLASQLRTNSVGRAYRLGGEEFVIIAERLALADAVTALNKLRAKIADRPFGVRDLLSRPVHTVKKGKLRATVPTRAGIIPITVSIGIAHSIPDHPATPEDILATADKALYQAKEEGRNLVRAAR
jgi:GGDEF domain-containing protein